MTSTTLLVNSAFTLVAASCAFLFGSNQANIYFDGSQNGILIGIISATAWGMGSMSASASFSGWANLLVAKFSATSLGFLSPADGAWRNAHFMAAGACQLRATPR